LLTGETVRFGFHNLRHSLASFLVDLNTNQWPLASYVYNGMPVGYPGPYTLPNASVAFIDAMSILSYRYAWTTQSLFSVQGLFGLPGANACGSDFIDDYSAGPPMVLTWPPSGNLDQDVARVRLPWSGSYNTNRYFASPGEFFDPTKIRHNPRDAQPTFVDRLVAASTNVSTYDRYTFYRMLGQLGTDAAPEAPPPAPRNAAWGTDPNSISNLLVTTTFNHSTFVGDMVNLTAGIPPTSLGTFRVISVRNARQYVLQGAGRLLGSGSGVAVDLSENAKVDLNYDNIHTNRESFTPWNPTDFFNAAADRLLRRRIGNVPIQANGVTSGLLPVLATNYLTYIPIYPPLSNVYTASLHRLLQMAANIYDSTTNRTYNAPNAINGFPTIFRPIFRSSGSNVVIAGYREATVDITNAPIRFLDDSNILALIPPLGTPIGLADATEPMVSGFPVIVGAKAGFPNFNQFQMQTAVAITRKLEFRLRGDVPTPQTNQMYLVAITNSFGLQAWNSYSNPYPRNLSMLVAVDMSEVITNELGLPVGLTTNGVSGVVSPLNRPPIFGYSANIAANTWQGYSEGPGARPKYSFVTPFSPTYSNGTFFFQTNASYSISFGLPKFVSPYQTQFEYIAGRSFYVPRWWLKLKTRVRFIVIDTQANPPRLVDYVNLESKDDPTDLTQALLTHSVCGSTNHYVMDGELGSMFCTNRMGGTTNPAVPTFGVLNQIAVGLGKVTASPVSNWKPADPAHPDQPGAISAFTANITGQVNGSIQPTNHFWDPYEPTRTLYFYTSWSANDPLVHYTVGDLTDTTIPRPFEVDFTSQEGTAFKRIADGNRSLRYAPWPIQGNITTFNPSFDLRLKDPQVNRSSDWTFPTNKYANIGWLGRVHRGTPWQTVYLKSAPIDFTTWYQWSGNGQIIRNIGQMDGRVVLTNGQLNTPGLNWAYDAAFSYPTNDWGLLDIFTTGFNDNSTLGRLNINQSELAAWSAVLGGVNVLVNTNDEADVAAHPGSVIPGYAPGLINPAGYFDLSISNLAVPPLVRIVGAINDVRATNSTRRVFDHLGDILAVPELTINSPFLNQGTMTDRMRNNRRTYEQNYVLTDAAYERIPQQILGLLNCDHTPRFVIYCWGQALRPADRSVLSSGPFMNLCTNYQVTAEAATRAVVRIDGAPNNPHAVVESFNVLPPD